LVQSGGPFGVLMSFAAFGLVSASVSNEAFLSWGWRLPFLVSIVLVFIGLWIRLRVAETPVFEKFQRDSEADRAPLGEVVTRYPREVITAVALKVSEISWAITGAVFSIVYITQKLHLARGVAIEAIQVASFVQMVITPFYGWLSDKVGRKPLYVCACLFSIAYAFPMFWLLDVGTAWSSMLAVVIAIGIGQGVMFGVGATLMPELFPTGVRYTGASLGFQLGAALSGGFSPLIMASIFGSTGSTTWISVYLIALACITLVATLSIKETAHGALK
jgi:MHS family shikimate/dehydroshikimate transporter-like MFS transporter